MDIIKFSDFVIRYPDGGQAGGLCGHNIHADTEISTQRCHTRSDKLHNFIIHITVFKYGTDNCQSHILRSDAFHRLTGQIDCYHTRHFDVICFAEQLFYQLRSTLAHCHGTQCTISCMRIRTKNHFSAACQHFTGKLMDDCLMRRYINSTISLCTAQTKHMVILVDGSTNSA